MATLGNITYSVQEWEDVNAQTSRTVTPVADSIGVYVMIGGPDDPYGTCTIGGVTIPVLVQEEHFDREGVIHGLFGSSWTGRSNNSLSFSLVASNATATIIVVTIQGSDGGSHAISEDTGWATLSNFDTTHTDPGVGSIDQVGILMPIGEAGLGAQTPTWDSTTGASSVHLGGGGSGDTGITAGLFTQGPDETSMNMGASGSVGNARFWVAASGWVDPDTGGGPLAKYGKSVVGV